MEISRRLRNLLMDHLAGASVLREIESEFEAADIAPGAPPEETGLALGQRRTLVQTYYNGLDFSSPADIRKFLNVLSVFMANLERQLATASPWASQTDDTYARQQFDKFQRQLSRDGYENRGGVIVPLTAAVRAIRASSSPTPMTRCARSARLRASGCAMRASLARM